MDKKQRKGTSNAEMVQQRIGAGSPRFVFTADPTDAAPSEKDFLQQVPNTMQYSLTPAISAGVAPNKSRSGSLVNVGPVHHKLENTYNMEPHPSCHFNAARVEAMLHSLMKTALDGVVYDAGKAPELVRILSEEAKERMKRFRWDRYKIVVHVILGSMRGQGIQAVSRSVWDTQLDNYASAYFKNRTLFAVAIVYGTYFE